MKINWIALSIISALVGGGVTYWITGNWIISIISSIIILIVVLLNNPKRRYMNAFYTVLFPLLSNIFFTIDSKTENFNVRAGLKELDVIDTSVLGGVVILCLLLDCLERNGKLTGKLLEINKNSTGNITGNNIHINQTINKGEATKDD